MATAGESTMVKGQLDASALQAQIQWEELNEQRLLQREILLRLEKDYLEQNMAKAARDNQCALNEVIHLNESLRLQINEQKAQIYLLEERTRAAEENAQQANAMLDILRLQLEEGEEARYLAEGICQQTRVEIADLCKTHEIALARERATHESAAKEAARLQERLVEKESQVKELKARADKSLKYHAGTQREARTKEFQFHEKLGQLKQQHNAQIQGLQKALDKAKQKLQDVRQEASERHAAVVEALKVRAQTLFHKKIEELSKKHAAEVAALQEELQKAKQSQKNAERGEKDKLRNLVKDLTDEREAARIDIAKLEKELQEVQSKGKKDSSVDVARLQAELTQVHLGVKEGQADRAALQEELRKSKQELAKSRNEVTVKAKVTSVLETENDRLEKLLKATDGKHKEALAKLQALRAEVNDLKIQVPVKNKPKENLTKNLQEEMAAAAQGKKEKPVPYDAYAELDKSANASTGLETADEAAVKGEKSKAQGKVAKDHPPKAPWPISTGTPFSTAADSQTSRLPFSDLSPNKKGLSPQRKLNPTPSKKEKTASQASRKRRLAPLVQDLVMPKAPATAGSVCTGGFKVPKWKASGGPTSFR